MALADEAATSQERLSGKMELRVSVDQASLKAVTDRLAGIRNGVGIACARAINHTVARGKTSIVKTIADESGLKTASVRAAISIKKATPQNLAGSIIIGGKGRPLIDFKSLRVSKRAGVSVQMMKNKPRSIFRHAFKATMKSGHVGIFTRKSADVRRLPIKELFGPGVRTLFEGAPELAQREVAKLQPALLARLEHEIEHLLRTGKPDSSSV